MIDLFYLKHRWKEFSRNPSSVNYIFVAVIFGAMVLLMSIGLYENWEFIKEAIESELQVPKNLVPVAVLWLVVIADLMAKIFIPKTFPKLFYYHTLNVSPKDIKVGYLIESIFSLWFILLFALEISVVSLCIKDLDLGTAGIVGLILFWLANTFISIYNFSLANTKVTALITGLLIVFQFLVISFPGYIPNFVDLNFLFFSVGLLLLSSFLAYRQLSVLFESALKMDRSTSGQFLTSLDLFKDPLMQLEVATLMRNKRARGTAIMGIVMIPYFLLIGAGKAMESEMFQVLISIMISGLFIFQMGTYIFAWEGSFFDLIMSKFSPRQFIEHKYRFFTYSSLFFSIILMVSLFFTYRTSLLLPLACFLYNIGWNIPFVINNGFKNTEKIDLNRGIFMNYQGFNGMAIVTMVGSLVPPIAILGVVSTYFGSMIGAFTLGLLGMIGILLKNTLIKSLSSKLEKKKYYLSACYRS